MFEGFSSFVCHTTHDLTAKSCKTFKIDKGTTIIIHFITAHFDRQFHPNLDVCKFDPMRCLGATPDEDQSWSIHVHGHLSAVDITDVPVTLS